MNNKKPELSVELDNFSLSFSIILLFNCVTNEGP
jgi:hypothetical protein